MLKKYRITYITAKSQGAAVIQARSKYDAKQKFYLKYPKYEIVKIEEVDNDT